MASGPIKIDAQFFQKVVKVYVRMGQGAPTEPSFRSFVLESNRLNVCAEIEKPEDLLVLQHAYLRIENKATGARLWHYIKRAGEVIKERVTYQNLEQPKPSQIRMVYNHIMDIWKSAEHYDASELVNLILARGNLNRISMSDPDWFDFPFIMNLLKKLEKKTHWDYAVLLINNVLSYEIGNGKNQILVKQKKISYLDNSVEGKTPCINHYGDEKQVRDMFRPYDFNPEKEKDEEPEPNENEEPESENLFPAQKKRRVVKPEKTNQKKSWFTIWFNSKYRSLVHGIEFKVYNIENCPIMTDGRIKDVTEYKTEQDINYFTGYKWTYQELEEAAETELGKSAITNYLNHLYHVICDGHKEQYEFLHSTLAHFVQRPGVKTEYCVYVKGQKGIGKSLLLFTPFQLLFHQHTCYLAGQLLADDFNGRLRDGVLLVNLDEFPQNIKNMQAFKSQITQGYMNVRPMFRESETVPNLMNFICTSNFTPSRQMEIGTDERRFLLIEARNFDVSQLDRHKKNINDFAKTQLVDNGLNTGFKAICYHFLKGVELDAEDLRLKIPVTPLMCKIIEQSMPLMERAIKKWIEQGGIKSLHRSEFRKEYDWDNSDCSSSWTWKELRQEALATLNEDNHQIRYRNINSDIESLKSFILTDEKTRQAGKKGVVTSFQILDRKSHYYNFRKFYPNILFYWTHPSLVITENPFSESRRLVASSDPEWKSLSKDTETWSELDFKIGFIEVMRALRTKGIKLVVNAAANTQSREFYADQRPQEPKRVRVYENDDEINPDDDDE